MQSNSSSRKVIPWHMQSRIKTELALNGEDPAQPERPEQRQEEAHARHTPLSASQSRSGPPPPLGGGVIVVLPPPSSGPRDCPHSDVTRQERYPFAEQSPSGYQRAAAIDDDDNYDDGWEEGEGDYYFILSAGRCGRELR